jgi:hypothetical protein
MRHKQPSQKSPFYFALMAVFLACHFDVAQAAAQQSQDSLDFLPIARVSNPSSSKNVPTASAAMTVTPCW